MKSSADLSKKDNNILPIAQAVDGFLLKEPAYFCIPGHRFSRGVPSELEKRFGSTLFSYDLTETEGLDDLHDAHGAIKEAQELASCAFGADKTWFLVNGTTSGIEAMILAAAPQGKKIIIASNAHKSALMGTVLSGAVPVKVRPMLNEEFKIAEEMEPLSIEKALNENPDAAAVLIVSPTYYGKASDIKKIARICHDHGVPLLVDEAHGAHFYFGHGYPIPAIKGGADMTAVSTHKTLGSMTQSSMLHFKDTRIPSYIKDDDTQELIPVYNEKPLIDIDKVSSAVKLVTSTSPSYILMMSLDGARMQASLHGDDMAQDAIDKGMCLRKGLSEIPGISVYGGADKDYLIKNGFDPGRVVFSAYKIGISGYELKKRLFEGADIALEMADERNCVAVVTSANTNEEILQLIMGVINAVGMNKDEMTDSIPANTDAVREKYILPKNRMVMTPREAYFAEKEVLDIEECAGKIAGEQAAVYPPGIPFIDPGEFITDETVNMLIWCRDNDIPVHGPSDRELKTFKVIKE